MINDINLEKLAIQVIKTAIKDAIKDTDKIKHIKIKEEAIIDKKEAIEFLTKRNSSFEFWCYAANLNPSLVFIETTKVISDPSYWKEILKHLKKLEI